MVKTIAQMLWAKKFENNIAKIVKAITRKVKINEEEEKIIPFLPLLILAFVAIEFLILTHTV